MFISDNLFQLNAPSLVCVCVWIWMSEYFGVLFFLYFSLSWHSLSDPPSHSGHAFLSMPLFIGLVRIKVDYIIDLTYSFFFRPRSSSLDVIIISPRLLFENNKIDATQKKMEIINVCMFYFVFLSLFPFMTHTHTNPTIFIVIVVAVRVQIFIDMNKVWKTMKKQWLVSTKWKRTRRTSKRML